jgi:hypothetical protein
MKEDLCPNCRSPFSDIQMMGVGANQASPRFMCGSIFVPVANRLVVKTYACETIAELRAVIARQVPIVAQVPAWQLRTPADQRMVDIVRRLARYPATRSDEMSAHDMRDLCKLAVDAYDSVMLAASPAAAAPRRGTRHHIAEAIDALDRIDDEVIRSGTDTLRGRLIILDFAAATVAKKEDGT